MNSIEQRGHEEVQAETQLRAFIKKFSDGGSALPDPRKSLLGAGKQTRFIRLKSATVLGDPDVEALLAAAIEQAKTPLPVSGRGRLIIRSVAATQRPRRRPTSDLGMDTVIPPVPP